MKLSDLRIGDVLRFDEDQSFVKPGWSDRIPGVHVIVLRHDDRAGNYVEVFNTFSGKQHLLLFVSGMTRIGNIEEHPETVECNGVAS